MSAVLVLKRYVYRRKCWEYALDLAIPSEIQLICSSLFGSRQPNDKTVSTSPSKTSGTSHLVYQKVHEGVCLLILQGKCIEHRRGLQDLEDNEKSCWQAIKQERWFLPFCMAKSKQMALTFLPS